MQYGQLRDHFAGVGVKRLRAVEAEPQRSNQHEVGTTPDMRKQFLGEDQHRRFPALYFRLGEDDDVLSVEGYATHYDTRARQPHRSPEWRLYYPPNAVTEVMREGDVLFLALTADGRLLFVVAPSGTAGEHRLCWLFGLYPDGPSFVSRDYADDSPEIGFAARYILDGIGIEFEDPDADRLDSLIERYGTTFPGTAEFSALARNALPDVSPHDDPDAALMAWLEHEEALFRRLERRVVAARLVEGFAGKDGRDVDRFMEFSLSVQNRRKSRMGYSLENHLEAIFQALEVPHERGAVTENNHRPDFLFPSVEVYRMAPDTGLSCLAMLGAKSTCKERWRQVLAEAAKIPRKHLLTLEPGISEQQTSQMRASDLQLVVPLGLQDSYAAGQRAWLLDLKEFIREIQRRLA